MVVVGQKVCYNFSGQLAIGVVEKVNKNSKARHSGYTFHIKRVYPKLDSTWHPNDISKVKDAKSIMVLFEANTAELRKSEGKDSKLIKWLKEGGND